MLFSWIGLRPSGLRRSQSVFIFISRFINKPFASLPRALWSFFLLGFSAYSFFNSLHEGRFSQHVRALGLDAAAPFVAIPRTYGDIMQTMRHYMRSNQNLKGEIQDLHAEIEALKTQKARADYLERENGHLRSILNVPQEFNHKSQRFKVLGAPFDNMRSSLIIAGSAANGLRKNQAVITLEGVIGRITDIGAAAARVMLITDMNSRIPVRIESTGEQAILAGQNTEELVILHKDKSPQEGDTTRSTPLAVGDRLVTSGYGGIFPPDLPVAYISHIAGDRIVAKPLATPYTAHYVSVIETPFNADAE